MPTSFETQTTSNKKSKNILGYIFLGVIGFIILAFIAMFSYFLWVEKYADPETKAKYQQTFRENFTSIAGLGNNQSVINRNILQYINNHNPQSGNAEADLTMLVFIDFECQFSREAYTQFEEIRNTYGPALNIVFKHFPIEQFHPQAGNAARAAQCAQEQNKFWEYYQQLFNTQKIDDASLVMHASNIGLNTSKFNICMTQESVNQKIAQDIQDGIDLGIRGTPTYFINQQKIEGVTPKEQWESIIIKALNQ